MPYGNFWFWYSMAATLVAIVLWLRILPVPDFGHRIFAVPDEKARDVLTEALKRYCGLRSAIRIGCGPIDQTILSDNQTTIAYITDEVFRQRDLPLTSITIPAGNPVLTACKILGFFKSKGYEASMYINQEIGLGNLPKNYLVVITAPKLMPGYALVIRKWIIWMMPHGKPH